MVPCNIFSPLGVAAIDGSYESSCVICVCTLCIGLRSISETSTPASDVYLQRTSLVPRKDSCGDLDDIRGYEFTLPLICTRGVSSYTDMFTTGIDYSKLLTTLTQVLGISSKLLPSLDEVRDDCERGGGSL